MSGSKIVFPPEDNGGRRLGYERRQFSYDVYVRERRSDKDRRSSKDRRSGKERRKLIAETTKIDQRSGVERRTAFR